MAKKTIKRKTSIKKKSAIQPKTYVGVVSDHSISMLRVASAAMKDFNSQLKLMKDKAVSGQQIFVSLMKCGVNDGYGIYATNKCEIRNEHIVYIKDMNNYETNGGSTPLFQAVGELTTIMRSVPDADDPNVSFLVIVVTDGEDNSSTPYWKNNIGKILDELQSTDKWTFAFRVPVGKKLPLVDRGIPEGNIIEWETTVRGMEISTQATVAGMDAYFGARSRGVTSTKSFYSTNLNGVSSKSIKSKLNDISSEVRVWNVYREDSIKPFIESMSGNIYQKGSAFYQLIKTEKAIQDYKQILIRDKKTGEVYAGVSARNLLGLPQSGTVKVVPGDHGKYDIFVQSTSVNRKLPSGTSVIYWPPRLQQLKS